VVDDQRIVLGEQVDWHPGLVFSLWRCNIYMLSETPTELVGRALGFNQAITPMVCCLVSIAGKSLCAHCNRFLILIAVVHNSCPILWPSPDLAGVKAFIFDAVVNSNVQALDVNIEFDDEGDNDNNPGGLWTRPKQAQRNRATSNDIL
jgi:hypothetical protein